MRQRRQHSKPGPGKKKRDSVFKEAWENMNEDMARAMPDFLARRLQSTGGKAWVMVAVALVELVVLGVAGKLLYDWLTR